MLKIFLRKADRSFQTIPPTRSVDKLYFDEKYKVWRIYSINPKHSCANDLRQIADKLDELNGVHSK